MINITTLSKLTKLLPNNYRHPAEGITEICEVIKSGGELEYVCVNYMLPPLIFNTEKNKWQEITIN